MDLFGYIKPDYTPQDKKSSFSVKRKANKQFDYYATPPVLIECFLKKHKIIGSIWEPACGQGFISEALKSGGYNDVFSSDIINRGYGEKIDFLKSNKKFDTIITNPPFNLIDKFLAKSKQQSNKQVIFIASTNFLKGKKRIKILLSDTGYPVKKVFIVNTSINYYVNGEMPKTETGFMMSCIVVFEKGYIGDMSFDWVIV